MEKGGSHNISQPEQRPLLGQCLTLRVIMQWCEHAYAMISDTKLRKGCGEQTLSGFF